mmetsp:Transcript_16735/g.23260  ORF Transcript_16735/g.23260 Transcript_16735/m.23260 type:complete len:101 (-) Transcript_16735:84-386(-)
MSPKSSTSIFFNAVEMDFRQESSKAEHFVSRGQESDLMQMVVQFTTEKDKVGCFLRWVGNQNISSHLAFPSPYALKLPGSGGVKEEDTHDGSDRSKQHSR